MSAAACATAGSFAEALTQLFHELASLLPGSGSGIWTAAEVTFFLTGQGRCCKIRICRYRFCVIYCCMCSFIDVGLMYSKVWSVVDEDDGSSGVVTDVAVSALPRGGWAAPCPRYLWLRIREPNHANRFAKGTDHASKKHRRAPVEVTKGTVPKCHSSISLHWNNSTEPPPRKTCRAEL